MSQFQLHITLLSDMCSSSGGIYNDAVDTEVTCDDLGIPYIPGKRIKGCLRECALEINDWGGKIPIARIFGEKGQQQGALNIRNAFPKDYEELRRELQACSGSLAAHPQNVLESFTYLRTQTEIDDKTDVARRNSLRTMRVVNRGTEFITEVSVPGQYEKFFRRCCQIFHHMGMARTRGYGEIRAELVAEKEETKRISSYSPAPGTASLRYEITLQEPMILKSVDRQENRSMDYIEGGKLLGMIAERLNANGQEGFLSFMGKGKFRVSNAYLTAKGERLMEAPLCLYEVKNEKSLRNKLFEDTAGSVASGAEAKLQLNSIKHSYIGMADQHKVTKYHVSMEERYHHSLPEDKSIGRTIGEGDDGGVFYQISAIRPGQTFSGFLEGTPEQIEEVASLFPAKSTVYMGYGSSSEYGQCELQILPDVESGAERYSLRRFAVLLSSPAIIYSRNAVYSTNLTDLRDEILAALGVSRKLSAEEENSIRYYNRIVSVGGFNVTWGMRKPTIAAFDKGTVVAFELSEPVSAQERFFIGERTSEGYGECRILPLEGETAGEYRMEYTDAEGGEENAAALSKGKQAVNLEQYPQLQKIAAHLFQVYMEEDACQKAGELLKEKHIGRAGLTSWRATVSNMILMMRDWPGQADQQDVFSYMKENCDDRYDVRDEGKREKGQIAGNILEFTRNSFGELPGSFGRNYGISGLEIAKKKGDQNDRSDPKAEYLMDMLLQLKYAMRSRERSTEASAK